MKRLLCVVILLFGVNVCFGFSGAKAKIVIKIIDEENRIIADANVSGGFWSPKVKSGKGDHFEGLTDTNGLFIAEGIGYSDMGFSINKQDYYRTIETITFSNYEAARETGKWQPYGATNEVVLKKIRNPVPMYVKRVNLGMPAMEQQVGYDLMVGDWVGPYGKGVISDFVFKAELSNVVPVGSKHPDEFDYQMTISFSNEKDGLQKMKRTLSSKLGSEHEAPADNYLAEWVQTRNRRKGKPEEWDVDFDSGYYFRVRSTLDEKGELKKAIYGKIYGDFLHFTYYLNPTPNDRNMEFDPKKNLFKNLSSLEEVSAP